jgi:hypothetical protein
MGTHEFNSRIEAQRAIVKVVNERSWESEPLLSLSRKSIDRWVRVNRVDSESRLVGLLLEASAGLFFLANRSQEQVSDEYRTASERIAALCQGIQDELATATPR